MEEKIWDVLLVLFGTAVGEIVAAVKEAVKKRNEKNETPKTNRLEVSTTQGAGFGRRLSQITTERCNRGTVHHLVYDHVDPRGIAPYELKEEEAWKQRLRKTPPRNTAAKR